MQHGDVIEKALYFARANVENYWHLWAGDKSEMDSLEKIDAALAELDALQSAQDEGGTWQPLEVRDDDLETDHGVVLIDVVGRNVSMRLQGSDSPFFVWTLKENVRLCQRVSQE